MRKIWMLYFLMFSVAMIACKSEKEDVEAQETPVITEDISFDQNKWSEKEEGKYLYRDIMLNDILYNDTIRSLSKSELIALLGEPDRTNEGHLYYLISRSGIGSFTLHAKTMVVKLKEDESIDWIKVHE